MLCASIRSLPYRIRVFMQENSTLVRSETDPFTEFMATLLHDCIGVTLQETLASPPFSPSSNDLQGDAPEPTHE